MRLIVIGLNHKTAPLALREAVAFGSEQLGDALQALNKLPNVAEAALLSTCNRTEIYAVASAQGDTQITEWLQNHAQAHGAELTEHLYHHSERAAVMHSLRVAAGLDSMMLGEPQILGQMKQAYQAARDAQACQSLLSRLFEHSFASAKKVRTETEIGANPVSVAFAAVSLARRIFADFSSHSALLIGAGETIELAARHLADQGLGRMVVANRSPERARALADHYRGYAIGLDAIDAHLAEADIVLSSTASPSPILNKASVKAALKQRRRKPMFMLDLAVPRDIAPEVAELEDVYLYAIDDLQDVIEDNLRNRQDAARYAQAMLELRADEFMRWLASRDAAGMVAALHRHSQTEQQAVLEKARRLLAQGQNPEDVIEYAASHLAKRLLHAPSVALRQAGDDEREKLIEAAMRLFKLD
ncbi:MAG: glutamyl-tRNA reductase [Nevskiales bacterium]